MRDDERRDDGGGDKVREMSRCSWWILRDDINDVDLGWDTQHSHLCRSFGLSESTRDHDSSVVGVDMHNVVSSYPESIEIMRRCWSLLLLLCNLCRTAFFFYV